MKKAITIILALCVLMGVSIHHLRSGDTQTQSADMNHEGSTQMTAGNTTAPAPRKVKMSAVRGEACTYSLNFDGNTELSMMGNTDATAVDMNLDLKGRVVLQSLGVRNGNRQIKFSFGPSTTIQYLVNGYPAQAQDGSLEEDLRSGESIILLNEHGTILELRHAEGTSSHYRNIAQMIASELQVSTQFANSWLAEEHTQHGVGVSEYKLVSTHNNHRTLSRTRKGYESLLAFERKLAEPQTSHIEGTWNIVVEDTSTATVLKEIVGSEEVLIGDTNKPSYVVRTHIEAEALGCTPVPVDEKNEMAILSEEPTLVTDINTSGNAKRNALLARVGTMTFDKMADDLMTYGVSAKMPDHNQWLFEVTGLLKLHPELCIKMVDIFAAPHFGHEARGLIMDLLASTGSPEAQTAMRAILNGDLAKNDSRYAYYLQRFSVVPNPTTETGDFILKEYESHHGPKSLAAAAALGAVSGHMSERGNGDISTAYNQRLVDDLAAAEDTDTQRALLMGLGNAADESTLEVIVEAGGSTEPAVRTAAVDALRDIDTEESRTALYGFLEDGNPRVEMQALRSLTSHALGANDLNALSDRVMDGAMNSKHFPELLRLAQQHRHHSVEIKSLLESVLEQGVQEPALEARIRGMLSQS